MPQRADTQADELIKKITRALEADQEPYVFTKEEVSDLQAIIALVKKFRALGWFAKWGFWALVCAGTIVVNLDKVKGVFK